MSSQASWRDAQALIVNNQLDEARLVAEALIAANPDKSRNHSLLGDVLLRMKDYAAAKMAFEQALAAGGPDIHAAHAGLAMVFRIEGNPENSLEHALEAHHRNKKHASILADSYAAMAMYKESLELTPKDPTSHVARTTLAIRYLRCGKFEEAWTAISAQCDEQLSVMPPAGVPLWQGQNLNQRRLLILSDEGLGDAMHFVGLLQHFKTAFDCKIIFRAQKPLVKLLSSCAAIDEVLPRFDEKDDAADYYLRIFQLPIACHLFLDQNQIISPYLKADTALTKRWQQVLSPNKDFKVGLSWQGNPQHPRDQQRSFSQKDMAPLATCSGTSFFSLQHSTSGISPSGSEQLKVIDLSQGLKEPKGSFLQTAAVLKNLNLLITCDSALVHLAGALGVPTWLALDFAPDWRWQRPETLAHYPLTRVFRQSEPGDWSSLFAEMASELPKLVQRLSHD